MAELNKLILPVKNTSTGVITNQEFDLPSGGGSSDDYMTKANPTGTGSFSLNRKDETTVGNNSVATGINCEASGNHSHAEGYNTVASGLCAHAEGYLTEATTNTGAHAEGASYDTSSKITASGYGAHAEGRTSSGYTITANATGSHAEGVASIGNTLASGAGAHAEGRSTTASGISSHSEGAGTTASGDNAHAEGLYTSASGKDSHAGGYYNTAGYDYQTVIGKFNSNKSDTLFEVGNGTSTGTARSNAFEVYSDGSISMDNGTTKFKLVSLSNSVTLSTSSEVTTTFTNSAITTDSKIDVYTTDPNLGYKTMSISSGSCSITYDKQDSASTITVSIDIH